MCYYIWSVTKLAVKRNYHFIGTAFSLLGWDDVKLCHTKGKIVQMQRIHAMC